LLNTNVLIRRTTGSTCKGTPRNKTIIKGTTIIGSKPKVQKQDSPEEIERKAKELAQKEANENYNIKT
jgi:hypothetical protein